MNYHINKRRGRYYLWYRGPWMSSGLEETLKTRDRRVAEKRMRERITEIEREHEGIIAPKLQRVAGQATLESQVNDYIEALKGDNRDRKYIANSSSRLRRLIQECDWRRLVDVTPDSFVTWRNVARNLTTGTSLSAKSKAQYQDHVHAFLEWLNEVGRIGHNPFQGVRKVDVRREDDEDKRAFADSELERLFALEVPQAPIYYLAYVSGMRWDELRHLTWGEVNIDDACPFWMLRRNVTKNSKNARYPMFGDAAAVIRDMRPASWRPTGKAFRHLVPHHRVWNEHFEAAGIVKLDPAGRKACFHSFRKTFNTVLQRQDLPIFEIMQLMRVSDRKLVDQTYCDGRILVPGEKNHDGGGWLAYPRSHGRSHGLVTDWHQGSLTDTDLELDESLQVVDDAELSYALAQSGINCHNDPKSSPKPTLFISSRAEVAAFLSRKRGLSKNDECYALFAQNPCPCDSLNLGGVDTAVQPVFRRD